MEGATRLLGIAITNKSLATIIAEAMAAIDCKRPPVVFACANSHSLNVAQEDRAFKEALNSANQLVADGIGVTVMGRLMGAAVGPRITGMEYFSAVMQALHNRAGGRVYFFGSSQEVLDRIARRVRREYPNITVCGTLSPPFRPWTGEENEAMVASINAARPDVLWVGMTAPKQEKWVAANQQQLDVPVIGSIGAVFDFFAGTSVRAPRWVREIGGEWLYRLIKEPRRMWHRYLVSSPRFVLRVIWRRVYGGGRYGQHPS